MLLSSSFFSQTSRFGWLEVLNFLILKFNGSPVQKLVPLLNFGWHRAKWGYPPYSHRRLIQTFLTDREILNGLAIHLIWSFGTYTDSPGFKKKKNQISHKYFENIEFFRMSERLCEFIQCQDWFQMLFSLNIFYYHIYTDKRVRPQVLTTFKCYKV